MLISLRFLGDSKGGSRLDDIDKFSFKDKEGGSGSFGFSRRKPSFEDANPGSLG